MDYLNGASIPSDLRDAIQTAALALADANIRYHYMRRTDPTSERAALNTMLLLQNNLDSLCNEAATYD